MEANNGEITIFGYEVDPNKDEESMVASEQNVVEIPSSTPSEGGTSKDGNSDEVEKNLGKKGVGDLEEEEVEKQPSDEGKKGNTKARRNRRRREEYDNISEEDSESEEESEEEVDDEVVSHQSKKRKKIHPRKDFNVGRNVSKSQLDKDQLEQIKKNWVREIISVDEYSQKNSRKKGGKEVKIVPKKVQEQAVFKTHVSAFEVSLGIGVVIINLALAALGFEEHTLFEFPTQCLLRGERESDISWGPKGKGRIYRHQVFGKVKELGDTYFKNFKIDHIPSIKDFKDGVDKSTNSGIRYCYVVTGVYSREYNSKRNKEKIVHRGSKKIQDIAKVRVDNRSDMNEVADSNFPAYILVTSSQVETLEKKSVYDFIQRDIGMVFKPRGTKKGKERWMMTDPQPFPVEWLRLENHVEKKKNKTAKAAGYLKSISSVYRFSQKI